MPANHRVAEASERSAWSRKASVKLAEPASPAFSRAILDASEAVSSSF